MTYTLEDITILCDQEERIRNALNDSLPDIYSVIRSSNTLRNKISHYINGDCSEATPDEYSELADLSDENNTLLDNSLTVGLELTERCEHLQNAIYDLLELLDKRLSESDMENITSTIISRKLSG